MDDAFVGTIILFAGNYAPHGWLVCDGRLLPIGQNQVLFAVIGVTYGGDGRTTFALPDLRGRVPVGLGQGLGLTNRAFGQTGGTEAVALTKAQMPVHAHELIGGPTPVTVEIPTYDPTPGEHNETGAGDYGLASGGTAPTMYATTAGNPPVGNLPLVTAKVTLPGQSANAGQGQPVATMPPFLGLNYIICLQGIFPSRD